MSKKNPSGAEGPGAARREEIRQQEQRLQRRMASVAHTVVVLSGKGGVGKSTVAANLAAALAAAGKRVGLLDADMHGPSIPRMFGLQGKPASSDGESILPVPYNERLKVMSIGFLLQTQKDAVIWRGPLKMSVLRQFLSDVEWGELDYLILDLPPGTGDEPLSVAQLLPNADGGILVTTPQEVALSDVRRCVDFCNKINLRVLGVVENMSGFICPHCGERSDIFGTDGGEMMAAEMEVPFLARVPLDPAVMHSCEDGGPLVEQAPDSEPAAALQTIARAVMDLEQND
mgnify:CR=1 FL=1